MEQATHTQPAPACEKPQTCHTHSLVEYWQLTEREQWRETWERALDEAVHGYNQQEKEG